MTELRAGFAGQITVPDNNQQLIGALNNLYDNSPTFRFGVANLSRPISVSFGSSVSNGRENYGLSVGGSVQIHSSFSSGWVPGSTAGNLGGTGAPLRWEVDANTSTWVQVAPSLLEVLAHEVFHKSAKPENLVIQHYPLKQIEGVRGIGARNLPRDRWTVNDNAIGFGNTDDLL